MIHCYLIELELRSTAFRKKTSCGVALITETKHHFEIPFNNSLFGAAFKLGHHDWFALRCFVTNLRNIAFTGVSETVLLNKPHKWTEELRIVLCKGYYMEHRCSGTLQPAKKFKMSDRWMKLQKHNYPSIWHFSIFVFPLQKVLC